MAKGPQKQFAGLALTPDGSQLLAADLTDGSLAVINPDSGSSSYIFVATAGPGVNGCEVGPLYVAATSNGQAFVSTGSLPAPSCPQSGLTYIVNLTSHAVATAGCTGGVGVDASADGNFVIIGAFPCIYSVQNASYAVGTFPFPVGGYVVAISGDANIIIADQIWAT